MTPPHALPCWADACNFHIQLGEHIVTFPLHRIGDAIPLLRSAADKHPPPPPRPHNPTLNKINQILRQQGILP